MQSFVIGEDIKTLSVMRGQDREVLCGPAFARMGYAGRRMAERDTRASLQPAALCKRRRADTAIGQLIYAGARVCVWTNH
jgi:hypothetical protein